MASVDMQKHGFRDGAAMVGHFARHDGREVGYRNRYIDPERSEQNFCVGLDGREVPTTSEMMDDLKRRVDEIDAAQPPMRLRQDRVTMMTYTVTAPAGLTPEKERAFFEMVHEEIARFSGGRENVTPGFVHRDEIHDYIDTDGSRVTSRSHLHMAGVPYTEEKGVNGKAFETRQRMRELNRTIDERCRRELGIKFMTGQKGLTGRSVEELQAASETRTIRQRRKELEREIDKRREEIGEMERERSSLSAKNADFRRDNSLLKQQADELEKKVENARMETERMYRLAESPEIQEAKAKRKLFSGEKVVQLTEEEYRTLAQAAGRVRQADEIRKDERRILENARKIEQAAELKKKSVSEMLAAPQLERLKQDHPEMFNSKGLYKGFTEKSDMSRNRERDHGFDIHL